MKRAFFITLLISTVFAANIFAQLTSPRASQRASVAQSIGDTEVEIVYNRPNVKGRTVWGGLVPLGEVWRTGANEATVFEVSRDVMINGQKLPKGKYSLHTIPTAGTWTIIFNKTWDQWGSFNYKAEEDALRVTAKPVSGEFRETMAIEIDNVTETTAEVYIVWDKLRVPFTVDIGDANKRFLDSARRLMVSNPVTAARFVLDNKLSANYAEAVTWLDASLAVSNTMNGNFVKAQILNAMGKKAEAITAAEKALQIGKASTPPANVSGVENFLKELKGTK